MITLLPHAILRTPLLPTSFLGQDPLIVFDENPIVQEAIYHSSPVLYRRISELKAVSKCREDELARIRLSLCKYIHRISYRCTPFGLNAGVSLLSLSNKTEIQTAHFGSFEKHVRLDMELLGKIHKKIIQITKTLDLNVFSNNTLYEVANTYRYYEYKLTNQKDYVLSSIPVSNMVKRLLFKSQDGSPAQDLVDFVIEQGFSRLESEDFIQELIANNVLITELEPTANGRHYQFKLKEFVDNCSVKPEQGHEYLHAILGFKNDRKLFDLGTNINVFNKYVGLAKKIGITGGDIFQIDLLKKLKCGTVDQQIEKNLRDSIKILYHLNSHLEYSTASTLQKFAVEFENRYEGMELPLLLIMDPDIGIGYPAGENISGENVLSDGLQPQGRPEYEEYKFLEKHKGIIDSYYNCISNNAMEFDVGEEILNELQNESLGVKSILSSMISIIMTPRGIEVIHTASERTGVNLAARFAYLNDEFRTAIESVAEREQLQKNTIKAEIDFLPEDRAGNITFKPHLGEYELPIISPGDGIKKVQLADLRVKVIGGKVMLSCIKTGAYVKPVFTSVYAHVKSKVPIFRFLCDLAYQDMAGPLKWMWGCLTPMPFHPRVKFRNIILHLATWKLKITDFKSPTINNRDLLCNQLKDKRIPLQFCIVQSDHILPIDLLNNNSFDVFVAEFQRYKTLIIQEDPRSIGFSVAKDEQGEELNNEIIVFWEDQDGTDFNYPFIPHLEYATKKKILSGLKWIYFKIYCGPTIADLILTRYISKVLEEEVGSKNIQKWFFIRYFDPDFHIRLRILCPTHSIQNVKNSLLKLFDRLMSRQLIWKLQEDTYNRELQRYGDRNINIAESFFYHDSVCVMKILEEADIQELTKKWMVYLLNVDHIFNDFGLDLKTKYKLILSIKRQMFGEFKLEDKYNLMQLASKYRSLKTEIKTTFETIHHTDKLFTQRSKNLKTLINKMIKLRNQGKLDIHFHDLVLSFIHMSLNRMIKTKQRLEETVVYDMLSQYYKSKLYEVEHSSEINFVQNTR